MTDVRIEIGSHDDVEPLVSLLEDAAAWLWDRGIHQWPPGSMRAEAAVLAAWANDAHLLVAWSGEG
jgi:hypothetical protein